MHHLECRFDHALLREQLAAVTSRTMKPFSDFSRPSPKANAGQCDANARSVCARQVSSPRGQFDQFTKDGAIGSHLENLKRKGGFKGFNRHAISLIISETDPRKQKSFAGP